MPSTAPAAPSRWPVIDLVAETATRSAVSPSTAEIAADSAMSPTGVDVAWALMWTTLVQADAAVLEGRAHGAGRAQALGLGGGDVVGVGGHAGGHQLGVDPGAAGLRVLLGLQHDHAGALAEHEAVAARVVRARGRLGVSLRVDRARIAANPAMGSGWIAASVPPAMTTSARPVRIMSSAYAMASAPDAQRRHRGVGAGAGTELDGQRRRRLRWA